MGSNETKVDSRQILGIALAGLGVLLLLGNFRILGGLMGTAFLGVIGLGFAAVHVYHPERLWPVIPAGVMFTLALISGLRAVLPWWDFGGIFFLGLSATFAAVFVAARRTGRYAAWALWPAGVLGLIGISVVVGSLARFLLPLVLIGIGAYQLTNRRER